MSTWTRDWKGWPQDRPKPGVELDLGLNTCLSNRCFAFGGTSRTWPSTHYFLRTENLTGTCLFGSFASSQPKRKDPASEIRSSCFMETRGYTGKHCVRCLFEFRNIFYALRHRLILAFSPYWILILLALPKPATFWWDGIHHLAETKEAVVAVAGIHNVRITNCHSNTKYNIPCLVAKKKHRNVLI